MTQNANETTSAPAAEAPTAAAANPAPASPVAAAAASAAPAAATGAAEAAVVTEKPAEVAAETAPTSEPAAWNVDWKGIVGDDEESLNLFADYKSAADLLNDVKKARTDWRDLLSGGDENLKKVLDRWTDPVNAGKAYVSLRQKMGDANYVRKPGPKASPEEVAEFRAAIGVPEDAKGYKVNMPEGVTPSDLDKAIIENHIAIAHQTGQTQEQVDANIASYFAGAKLVQKQTEEAIKQIRAENEDTLRLKWGPEYRGHLDLAKRFLNDHMADFGSTDFLELELKNGARVGDFLPFVEWAAQMGRNMYGAGAMLDGEGSSSGMSIDEEYKSMIAKMGTPEYGTDKFQNRLKELARIRARRVA